jgi:hypothetical protein
MLTGAAYPLGTAIAYDPLLEALGSHLRALPAVERLLSTGASRSVLLRCKVVGVDNRHSRNPEGARSSPLRRPPTPTLSVNRG